MYSVKLEDTKLIHRNLLHFYKLITKQQNDKLRKIIPLTIALTRIKYIGINLTKEVQDLYSQNYKTLMKEIKDDTNEKIFHAHRLEELISLKCLYSPKQSTDSMQSLSNTNSIFHRTRTKNTKIWGHLGGSVG